MLDMAQCSNQPEFPSVSPNSNTVLPNLDSVASSVAQPISRTDWHILQKRLHSSGLDYPAEHRFPLTGTSSRQLRTHLRARAVSINPPRCPLSTPPAPPETRTRAVASSHTSLKSYSLILSSQHPKRGRVLRLSSPFSTCPADTCAENASETAHVAAD
jgi:hypothetical protein